jgi:hypothetical protein
MGRLIPAGTGLEYYRNVELVSEEPEPVVETNGVEVEADANGDLARDEEHEERLST